MTLYDWRRPRHGRRYQRQPLHVGQQSRRRARGWKRGEPPHPSNPAKVQLFLGSGSGTGTNTSTGSGGGNPSKTYEELAQQLTPLFTGKDYEVRLCADAVDNLFPNGVGGNIEPSWSGPFRWVLTSGSAAPLFPLSPVGPTSICFKN